MKRLDVERNGTKIKSVCAFCGKDAWVSISNYKRQKHAYCSPECKKAWRLEHATGKVDLFCDTCNKQFTIPKAWKKRTNHHFCSQACYSDYQHQHPHGKMGAVVRPRQEKTCPHCNTVFLVNYKRVSQQAYCSYECRLAARTPTALCEQCGRLTDVYTLKQGKYLCAICKPTKNVKPIGICKRCGKIYRQWHSSSLYCSEECRRPTHLNTCPRCGKQFRVTPSEAAGRRFCSSRCYRCFTGETEPEKVVRLCLNALGIRYFQEHIVKGWKYPIDFFLPDTNTALEVDGVYWHSTPKAHQQDARKTIFLQSRGYTVIRLPDTPFYGNVTDGMIGYIRNALSITSSMVAQSDLTSLYPIQLSFPFDQEGMI